MMCAIMNKLRAINAAARHRLVFDLRIPVLLYPGTACSTVALAKADAPAVARREIGPVVFSSRLMHPLFTRLANLAQNPPDANCSSRQRRRNRMQIGAPHSQKTVTKLLKDFLYFSGLVMRSVGALLGI